MTIFKHNGPVAPVIAAAFVGLTVWLGYFVQREQFWQLTCGWLAFFPLLFFVKKLATTDGGVNNWLFLGIFLRFLLLFSWPNLSDDFWRFIWDGRLWLAGQHPFAHPPDYFFEKNDWPPGLSATFYGHLNSKRFHTVYPPVCQAVFATAAFLGKNSDHAALFLMKTFLFACECATIFLLKKMAKATGERAAVAAAPLGTDPVLIYALCPLPIFEVVGNCHFEGAMLCFLLAGLYFFQKKEGPTILPALFFALAIAAKLLPLMFLPLLLPVLGPKKWAGQAGWLAVFSAMLWLPMFDLGVLENMFSSLGLYFRAFEFNASFYYLLKPFARNPEGFDRPGLLGPLLAAAALLSIIGLAGGLFLKKIGPAAAFLAASMVQLLFASTVHPWYVLTPFLLCFFTKYRFPVVWGGVVVFSYSHYLQRPFHERFEMIGIEYVAVLLFFIFEIWGSRYFFKKMRL